MKYLKQLTIEHLWAIVVLASIFIFMNTHPIRPQDFWWHLKIGEITTTTGQIPEIDPFSQTRAGIPYTFWVYWLMQSAFYLIYQAGGPALIVFIHSIVITTTYGLLLHLNLKISKDWRIATFTTLFAVIIGFNDWNVRPQAIAFLLASIMLTTINAYQNHPQNLLLTIFPLCIWIWVNSHGSFFIGFIILGLWLSESVLDDFTKKKSLQTTVPPIIALLTSGLACLLTPKRLEIINYLNNMKNDPAIQHLIPEWGPPTFETLSGQLFMIALLGSITILILSPRRPTFRELLTFLGFATLGLKTKRGSIWYGIMMAPVLAHHVPLLINTLKSIPISRNSAAPLSSSQTKSQNVLNTIFLLCIILTTFITLPWFKKYLPLSEEKISLLSTETPVKATQVLLDIHPPGQLFNYVDFGSYLAWAALPDYPVFVDTRIEHYTLDIWQDYFTISNAQPDWETLLIKYDINTLMLEPKRQAPLIKAVQEDKDWQILYEDQTTIIFNREPIE